MRQGRRGKERVYDLARGVNRTYVTIASGSYRRIFSLGNHFSLLIEIILANI